MRSDQSIRDAVAGREKADLTNINFENALFQHNTSARIEHPNAPNWGDGNVALGLDLKMTPEGEWEVIELMSEHFGSKGYSEAYQWGDISLGEVTIGYNDLADSLNFVEDKTVVSQVLPSGRSASSVEDYLETDSNQIIYVKNPNSDGGTGVEVLRAAELDRKAVNRLVSETGVHGYEDLMVEERVASTTETIDGREHDRCMRYAVVMDGSSGGIDLTFKGGYWKVSPKPLEDEEASLNEKYLANLNNGISRPASFRELREATEFSMDVAQEVFSAAIQKRMDGDLTQDCWELYGKDISHEWEDEYMEWTAYNSSEKH